MAQQAADLEYSFGDTLHDSDTSVISRARRLADKTAVVIKLAKGNSISARQLTRYRNEYELLRSLDLSGVVKAYDLIKYDGQLALVLEDFGGESLKQWLARGQLALADSLELAIQIASVISQVHAANIIHKDINSHNIVYNPDTKICKLIDFGIATQLRSEESKFRWPTALEGTLLYIAPEQTGRMNRRLDYRADLYSLGVTFYELLTGALPHYSLDPLEIVHFHIAGTPKLPCEQDPGIPVAISDIVMKLLAKAPEDRYQSAAGLVADLRWCQEQLLTNGSIEPFTLGECDLIDRFEPPQKLYGRDAELATLLATVENVAAGDVGAMLVAGHAGIGKTALVQEIYKSITDKRGYFVSGKFDQLQRDIPFSALVAALQDLVQQLLTESEESIARWRQAIQSAVGDNGHVIVNVVPALELIIGSQAPVQELDPVESQNRFNMVFQNFIQVFCRKEHPLILFLDDMQWADSASLSLVTLILSAQETESLLIVEAYRDEEVSATHPFMLVVKDQRELGVNIGSVELISLNVEDTAQFVADTLRTDIASATPLADVIWHKTGGNPFFIRQFLQALYTEKLIYFDAESNTFCYNLTDIKDAAITENVAELLTRKIDKLPQTTQDALRLAAAIGSCFDLETLSVVYGHRVADSARHLERAVVDGLIHPTSGLESLDPTQLDSPLIYQNYAFLHDRVQQAAYATIGIEERASLHLTIGRVLLSRVNEDQIASHIFDIVNHLNQGLELIDDVAEKLQLSTLNMVAGSKARNSTAFVPAVSYFRNAVKLLGESAWEEDYPRQLEAHQKLAESLGLTTDYGGAFDVIEYAAERAVSETDRAKLYTLKTSILVARGDMAQAVNCGIRAAELFGLNLPDDPEEIKQQLQAEIGTILAHTSKTPIESLIDLPTMQDPDQIALMSLLMHIIPPAYQINMELFALICCKMVTLSIEYGNCPVSAKGYGSFAVILSSALGNYADADRFGKLGVNLNRKFDDISVRSAAYFVWAAFASHWNKPIDESIELFRAGIRAGLQSGDHPHAAYNAARCITHMYFKGMPLPELLNEAKEYLGLLHRVGDVTNVELLRPRIRFIEWLLDKGAHGNTLDSEDFDEDMCAIEIRKRGSQSILSHYQTLRLAHRYLRGDLDAAFELAQESESLLNFSAGFITVVEHNFYYSLTLTGLHTTADQVWPEERQAKLDSNQEQLKRWAEVCPENFRHMYLLVSAECARIRGSAVEAMNLYDQAIDCANENGFVHIEALANELAERFWSKQHKADFAKLYRERALNAYDIWGAHGKLNDLQDIYDAKSVGAQRSSNTKSLTTSDSRDNHHAFDLAAVIKANQAISSEIVLDRLLPVLMNIIMESAGADCGSLILEYGGSFLVQASKQAGENQPLVMNSMPLEKANGLSQGIVNYVIRTREHLVLDEPATHGAFRNDPYVRLQQPKSVLCAPIVHKGNLTGVLYLENNLVAGAITPDRLEALNLLVPQIAVSIENATLYSKQEQQALAIEQSNVVLTKEIAERKRAEQELSRYQDHLEELVKERTRELESAQGRLVDLSRKAGMAEVASGVLHNVGNVMTSVNVGASMARTAVKSLRIEGITAVADLMRKHEHNLGDYLINDPAGKKVPEYLEKLSRALFEDRQAILSKMGNLIEHLDHMKKIISAQQGYAKMGEVVELCQLHEIAETALSINETNLRNSGIEIVRDYAQLPPALVDRHQLMQILVNLISNAKHALEDLGADNRVLKLTLARKGENHIRIQVQDNGVGISRENLTRIFHHGFTTRKSGHGFGLHNCANAAQQMNGALTVYSEGIGKGARFVLEIPVKYAADEQPQTNVA